MLKAPSMRKTDVRTWRENDIFWTSAPSVRMSQSATALPLWFHSETQLTSVATHTKLPRESRFTNQYNHPIPDSENLYTSVSSLICLVSDISALPLQQLEMWWRHVQTASLHLTHTDENTDTIAGLEADADESQVLSWQLRERLYIKSSYKSRKFPSASHHLTSSLRAARRKGFFHLMQCCTRARVCVRPWNRVFL
jgi:hypothetical protein